MMIRDLFTVVLIVLGVGFAVAGSIGIVRFRDTLARAHALSVTSTIAVVFVMAGVVVGMPDLGSVTKAILTVVFIFLTSPVGAHMLGRSVYMKRASRLELQKDELAAHRREVE